jgi:predicted membrane GTPase involved in stress response
MSKFEAQNIRNVAIVGHSGEGKTSLAEAMLFNGKAIDRMGKTTDGNTVMDFDEQEIARGISVSLSVAYAVWNDVKINTVLYYSVHSHFRDRQVRPENKSIYANRFNTFGNSKV